MIKKQKIGDWDVFVAKKSDLFPEKQMEVICKMKDKDITYMASRVVITPLQVTIFKKDDAVSDIKLTDVIYIAIKED